MPKKGKMVYNKCYPHKYILLLATCDSNRIPLFMAGVSLKVAPNSKLTNTPSVVLHWAA